MALFRFGILAFSLVIFAPGLGLADDFNMKIKIDTVRVGKPVWGEELKPGEIKGRVVLFYYWGCVDCPVCLTALPTIARFNEELAPFGLITVGAHAQISTPERIKASARAHGANFIVVEQAFNVEVKGRATLDFKPIPHCILYDQSGKCIYRGLPDQLEPTLRQTIGKCLADKFEAEAAKPIAALLDGLRKGQPPATILQRAVALTKSSDKEVADQAKELITQLTAVAEKMATEMDAMRSSDPVAAYARAQRFSTDFKGTPPGIKAAEIAAELKKDKVVLVDAKARPTLEKVRAMDEALAKAVGIDDPKGKDFHKAQSGPLKQLQSTVKAMRKSWPDAPSTKEAVEIADGYGLSLK
jgi:thiol-disulfide isomerase/thioredoxin